MARLWLMALRGSAIVCILTSMAGILVPSVPSRDFMSDEYSRIVANYNNLRRRLSSFQGSSDNSFGDGDSAAVHSKNGQDTRSHRRKAQSVALEDKDGSKAASKHSSRHHRSLKKSEDSQRRALASVDAEGVRLGVPVRGRVKRGRHPAKRGGRGEEGGGEQLKVFVYDLDEKFNFGLMEMGGSEEVSSTFEVEVEFKRRPKRTLGRGFEHSAEYFITADILSKKRSPDSVAVRVSNPAEADVFFVPFFSSLSFNLFGTRMRDSKTERDRILQEELLVLLRASPWWQRRGGRDHVLCMVQPNALKYVRHSLSPAIFLVADFGRYSRGTARLSKDVVVPYNHILPSFSDDPYAAAAAAAPSAAAHPWDSRPLLLFFQGNIVRKDEGYIRGLLYNLLKDEPDVHFNESRSGIRGVQSSTEGMRRARFCLHPAGDTPSSCRLFDAVVSHCVPVIVSNKLELPFESAIDYSDFAIFLSHEDALRENFLISFLRNFDKALWLRMYRRLVEVERHFEFQVPSKPNDAIDMIWKEVKNKLPSIKLTANRRKRLVISDWTQ